MYSWNFGDGTTQSGSLNPSHTYANPGSYTATVTVTDADLPTSSSSAVVTVNDVAPTVSLNAPSTGTTGMAVSFSSTATDVSPVDQAAGFTYSWNFGDGTTGTGASPSHTYSATGTYTISVTATDTYGKTSMQATAAILISAATVGVGSTININATWLQQQGPGPYVLSQANTTYVLQTDVTTYGTAFVIANKYVTLNLNGHTITYNNAAPLTVPNGNFGADPIGSNTVTDWNLSGAPNSQFTVQANDAYLYSPQIVNWVVPSGTTPQVIQSQLISGLTPNQTYTASVAESPLGSIGDCNLQIQVVDAVTGDMSTFSSWRRYDAGAIDQAPCPSFDFIPTTTDPVFIRITMIPQQSTGASVKIDRVVLTQSMDCGVFASITSIWGLQPPIGGRRLGEGRGELVWSAPSTTFHRPSKTSRATSTRQRSRTPSARGASLRARRRAPIARTSSFRTRVAPSWLAACIRSPTAMTRPLSTRPTTIPRLPIRPTSARSRIAP